MTTETDPRRDPERGGAREERPVGPELFFGLVGAVGTDLTPVATAIKESLRSVEYETGDPIRLSDLLRDINRWADLPGPGAGLEDERIELLMEAGSKFREALQRGDSLAVWALGAIRDEREAITGDVTKAASRHAYILHSLKHPDE